MGQKGRWLLIFSSAALCALTIWQLFANPKDDRPPELSVSLAHDKGNLPVFQENFIKQGKNAKKAIGIDIIPVPSSTPDLFRHRMKATLATEQAPELFIWWSTFRVRELVEQDVVGDLTEVWNKYSDDYSMEMREAFTIGDTVYGFPYVVEYWPVWYNKNLFSRLGMKEPTTWTEFIGVCDKLKAAGVPPIMSSLQLYWMSFIWFEEMIIGEDPDLYKDLCLGKARYTDPRVVSAFRVWKDMIEKDYFTDPSVNMLTNSGYLWNNEKFGMVLCGTWYYSSVLLAQGVDDASIGCFILPSHNPKAGKNVIFEVGPIFTAKKAANAEAGKKVVDWWMSREGSESFTTMHKAYPGNLHTDTEYLPQVKKDLLASIQQDRYRLLNRYWEATPAPICEKAVLKFGEFILDPGSLDEILTDVDRMAEGYWADDSHP